MRKGRLEGLLAIKSFVLWLKGQCSFEEQEQWDNWLRKNPEQNKELVKQAREVIGAREDEHTLLDSHAEMEKLNRKIDKIDKLVTPSQNFFYQRTLWSNKYSMGSIVAGILLLFVVLGNVVAYKAGYLNGIDTDTKQQAQQQPAIEEYRTDYGEKLTFRLSDGSNIVLNANSKLRFSSTIEKGLNMEVWLKGEAYFDIAHFDGDQQRMFTVHTDGGNIQVLGTRFTVNTFQDRTQAVLEEGEISVKVKEENLEYSKEYLLKPGEMARFTAFDNKISVKKVNTHVYTSWKEDKFIFDKTPMYEVATRIENTFGIDMVVDKKYADNVLSGSIKSSSVDVLREALEEILNTDIEQQGKKLLIR